METSFQIGMARHLLRAGMGGEAIGNFPFGVENLSYDIRYTPQVAEYYSNEGKGSTDLGSWIFRMSPKQGEHIFRIYEGCAF